MTVLYRAVVQLVVLFGLKSWVLSTAMEKTVEGSHTGFLQQTTGNQARQMIGGIWVTSVEEEV